MDREVLTAWKDSGLGWVGSLVSEFVGHDNIGWVESLVSEFLGHDNKMWLAVCRFDLHFCGEDTLFRSGVGFIFMQLIPVTARMLMLHNFLDNVCVG